MFLKWLTCIFKIMFILLIDILLLNLMINFIIIIDKYLSRRRKCNALLFLLLLKIFLKFLWVNRHRTIIYIWIFLKLININIIIIFKYLRRIKLLLEMVWLLVILLLHSWLIFLFIITNIYFSILIINLWIQHNIQDFFFIIKLQK